jgi:hypothetical protein
MIAAPENVWTQISLQRVLVGETRGNGGGDVRAHGVVEEREGEGTFEVGLLSSYFYLIVRVFVVFRL